MQPIYTELSFKIPISEGSEFGNVIQLQYRYSGNNTNGSIGFYTFSNIRLSPVRALELRSCVEMALPCRYLLLLILKTLLPPKFPFMWLLNRFFLSWSSYRMPFQSIHFLLYTILGYLDYGNSLNRPSRWGWQTHFICSFVPIIPIYLDLTAVYQKQRGHLDCPQYWTKKW